MVAAASIEKSVGTAQMNCHPASRAQRASALRTEPSDGRRSHTMRPVSAVFCAGMLAGTMTCVAAGAIVGAMPTVEFDTATLSGIACDVGEVEGEGADARMRIGAGAGAATGSCRARGAGAS